MQTRLALVSCVAFVSSTGQAAVLFDDQMNRATFDAPTHGWTVQTYDKANSKGVYGRLPAGVDSNRAMRYGVQSYSPTDIRETNTVVTTPTSFAPPTGSNYLEFAASLKINYSSANQAGLVFGLSAYGSNAAKQEDAVNMEFLTNQLNTNGTNTVAYDRIDLTAFNDYTTDPANKWYTRIESGTNSTDNYHTYAMRIFTDRVDYLVDGNLIISNNSVVPSGTGLKLVLVAWAPDSTWPSATGTLPSTGFWYMDVNFVQVSTGTTLAAVPEPLCLGPIGLMAQGLLRRRRVTV